MVDISSKEVTVRSACAQSQIQLTEEMRPYFSGKELILKKGPVFQTAIIAATMAVKKTSEIIPFCHPLPIESCKITISHDENLRVTILCEVKTIAKTGIEMEALHGAMTAALTIYDMCKALSHKMTIGSTQLISKTGGKRTLLSAPLYGLVLTGGKSTRMKSDKALLNYHNLPQAQFMRELLLPFCQEVYLSARRNQWEGSKLEKLPTLQDTHEDAGPIAGLLAAFERHPEANWLVLACDLPFINKRTLEHLLANFDPSAAATCFRNKDEEFPEALCAIYTPQSHAIIQKAFAQGIRCPVKILKNSGCKMLEPQADFNLANVNTPAEFNQAMTQKIHEAENEIR